MFTARQNEGRNDMANDLQVSDHVCDFSFIEIENHAGQSTDLTYQITCHFRHFAIGNSGAFSTTFDVICHITRHFSGRERH